MVLREVRRFVHSSRLLCISGVAVLSLGLGISALALTWLLAFSSLSYSGMRAAAFATIAVETEGGGSTEMAWDRFEQLCRSDTPGVTVAAYSRPFGAVIGSSGDKHPVRMAAVSARFFEKFTAPLIGGANFTVGDELSAGTHKIILSEQLAATLFHRPLHAIGEFVLLNDAPYQIVGVASPSFHGAFGEGTQVWVPASAVIPLVLQLPKSSQANPDTWKVVATFDGLATTDRASSHALASDLYRTLPLRVSGSEPLHVSQGLTTDPIRDERLRKWLRLGLALSLLFTLASSLSVCLLLLARAPVYADEIRLKKALGAQNRHVVSELLVGPSAMVLVSLLAATVLWIGGLAAISRISDFYRHLLYGSFRQALAAFALQVGLAGGLVLLVAFAPALSSLREGDASPLTHSGNSGRRTGLLTKIPVALQIACCVGACILAGMLGASLVAMLNTPLGFHPENLTTVSIAPAGGTVTLSTGSGGQTSPEALALDRLMQQVKTLPGVQGVSYTSSAPLDDLLDTELIARQDRPSSVARTVEFKAVSPGYFKLAGARLLIGSDFSGRHTANGLREIVANRSLARELWPGENPIGKTVKLVDPARNGMPAYSYSAAVVGVAEDMRLGGYMDSSRPTFFESSESDTFMDVRPHLVVSGTASRHALETLLNRQVPLLMPGMGVDSLYSVEERMQTVLRPERYRVYGALAGALIMAAIAYIGLYGALGYYLRTKRRELAVRICLGASAWSIRLIIVRQALSCIAVGVALSLPFWLVLARLAARQSLGQMTWSTSQAVAITFLCTSGALLVSLAPASVAAAISPSQVLKEQ